MARVDPLIPPTPGEFLQPGRPPLSSGQAWRRPVFVSLLLLSGVLLAWQLGLYDVFRLAHLSRLQGWVEGHGPWGPVVYIVGYVALELVFVPALPLSILGGLAFGPFWGTVYVWIAATGSATLAFLVARHGARATVEAWVARSPQLARIDAAVTRYGWRILVITRLVPFFPFNLQNFAYGLTAIRLRTYVGLTALCALPGTVALTLAGGTLAEGGRDLRWLLIYLGAAAPLLLLLHVLPRWVSRWGALATGETRSE